MKLPSWVPELTAKCKVSPLQQRALLRQSKPLRTELQPDFNASGNLLATDITIGKLEDGKPTLSLQGFLVGAVERIGCAWENHTVGAWINEFKDTIAANGIEDTSDHLAIVSQTAVADQEIRQGNKKPRMSAALLQKVVDLLKAKGLTSVTSQDFLTSGLGDYLYQMTDIARGRRPFSTSKGHLGIAPAEARPRDLIYILSGCQVPCILRPTGGCMSMVGEAFAYGLMDGEATTDNNCEHTVTIC